jgi:Protein of unknown function (DUF3147)
MKKLHIAVNPAALRRTKWYEYLLRFIFGGAITAVAGIIARRYGPGIGGVFLAFPAIFPASATLIEKHEKQKKRKAGLRGTVRGRQAAGLDAVGAALGSVGLAVFAVMFWMLIPRVPAWLAIICATIVWMLVSGSLWYLRKMKAGLHV